MEPTASIRQFVWPIEEANRWHTRWALFGVVCGTIAFLLPVGQPTSETSGWSFRWHWQWDWDGSRAWLLFSPLLIAIALFFSRRFSAASRGWLLIAASVCLCLLYAFSVPRFGMDLDAVLSIGFVLLLVWAAAAAHTAYRFGPLPRYRVPLVISGVLILLMSIVIWMLRGRVSTDHWLGFAVSLYGLCQVAAGISSRRGMFRAVRWMGRLGLFAAPIFTLLVFALLGEAWGRSSSSTFMAIWIVALKVILTGTAFVLQLGLGIANVGDADARRSATQRFTAKVFE